MVSRHCGSRFHFQGEGQTADGPSYRGVLALHSLTIEPMGRMVMMAILGVEVRWERLIIRDLPCAKYSSKHFVHSNSFILYSKPV